MLFGSDVTINIVQKNQLIISEKQEVMGTEIMYCGAATRKIFATLASLYSLISIQSSRKIFIIEDPEVHLYGSVTSSFMKLLRHLTNSERIQLVVVSNSNEIRQCFEDVSFINLISFNLICNQYLFLV